MGKNPNASTSVSEDVGFKVSKTANGHGGWHASRGGGGVLGGNRGGLEEILARNGRLTL